MKKKGLLILVGSICLVLILAALPFMSACAKPAPAPSPAPVKPIELSHAATSPAKMFINSEILASWFDEIDKATNGRVKFTLYPAQTLCKAGESWDATIKGIADLSIAAFSQAAGRFPLMEGFDLTGIPYNNAMVGSAVARDIFEEYKPVQETLSEVKVLWLWSIGPSYFWTKTPVRKLEDLKGLRMTATGAGVAPLKALGATPVAMPMPTVYEALSKGVVDGSVGPVEAIKSFRHAEVVKYVTIGPPIYSVLFFDIMNLEKWNSLPKDIQDAFDKVNKKWWVESSRIFSGHNTGGLKYAIEEGCEIITISGAEKARWDEKLAPLQGEWAAKAEKAGLPGKELLDKILKLTAKYNKEYPELPFKR